MKTLYHYIIGLCALLLIGCNSDELVVVNDEDSEIMVGEQIQFTSMLPDDLNATRTLKEEWLTEVGKYSPVNHDYSFAVTMWKRNAENESTLSGTSTYKPMQTTDIGSTLTSTDGTLKPAEGSTPLYWQDNVSKWGFTAEANNTTLLADQSTQEKWLAMDYLKGHSYLPVWTETEEEGVGSGTDPNNPMFMTSKEWYKTNREVASQSGLMVSSNEDYKKIPLYMQHQRAWITVILKAGEGVSREALAFDKAEENIRMAINSFTTDGIGFSEFAVTQPWASEYFIDYAKDANGEAAANVSTTRYDAIVEPHNYGGERKDKDVIAKINLSNQNFSFYASNDTRYINGTEAQKQEADAAYNLEAGKHLTITVTLSRESRKILITAWIEDWTEVVTSTICDDYGQNGDPVVIKNRQELIDFLKDPKKNVQGSVGIIQPTELDLDPSSELVWSSDNTLRATLNLAGCTLKTSHRLFKYMTSSANLVNGTVMVKDNAQELLSAISLANDGSIERVNVVTSGENSPVKATMAGLVVINRGTIYQCNSTLPVYGTVPYSFSVEYGGQKHTLALNYVGGIAAASSTLNDNMMAVIDGCTVNAPVKGEGTAESGGIIGGGGIVGYALGRVTNNTFEYGITINQDQTKFKNIVGAEANYGNSLTTATQRLRAYSNSWPTTALNEIEGNTQAVNENTYQGMKFDAVIDCEDELKTIMTTAANNVEGKNYRISKSFVVSSDTWPQVIVSDATNTHNVRFNLDGNDKTITLTGNKTVETSTGSKPGNGEKTSYTTAPMLFNYVLGEIKDLTLYLEKSIVAEPSKSEESAEYNATDAIAPLAYAVYGENGKLSNIKVKAHKDANNKNDVYVQAATPAGLVVWAFNGATVSNCRVQVPVKMWLPSTAGTQAKHYAGGIVACAADATISGCEYLVHSNDALSSAYKATGSNHYYGGIVGGTSKKESETPSLQIVDCTSWFLSSSVETGVGSRGSIIGFACYADTGESSALLNGMDKSNKSEGNWWTADNIGAHTRAEGLTEEMVIGKRNAVTPTYDDSDL